MLEAMFSGRHPNIKDEKVIFSQNLSTNQGHYFIDREPSSFKFILYYLRTGQLLLPADETTKKMFWADMEYYGLHVSTPKSFPGPFFNI